MNTVTFFRKDNFYFGFISQGHAGEAPAGGNVVCAAVSEAVRFSANLLEAFGRKPQVKSNEKKAEISLSVPVPDTHSQAVFGTLLSEMRLIQEEYPKNVTIHITEV